jgi:single-strand DNA-binding protein
MNKVILLGNLGKDPESKYFDENNLVVNFTLATNETYKDKQGQRITQTEWHNIRVSKNGLAKVAEQYLKKGEQVLVEGKIRSRSYDDKDGTKKYITEIIAENIKMLSHKPAGEAAVVTNTVEENIDPFNINDEELPF